jgi:hypothetical protein
MNVRRASSMCLPAQISEGLSKTIVQHAFSSFKEVKSFSKWVNSEVWAAGWETENSGANVGGNNPGGRLYRSCNAGSRASIVV